MHRQGLDFSKVCPRALAVSPTVGFVPITTSNVSAVGKACDMERLGIMSSFDFMDRLRGGSRGLGVTLREPVVWKLDCGHKANVELWFHQLIRCPWDPREAT